MSDSAWILLLNIVITLEIAVTAALLWLFFYLCEYHDQLRGRLSTALKRLHGYKESLKQVEESLLMACRLYGQMTMKWHVILKVGATVLEKISAKIYC